MSKPDATIDSPILARVVHKSVVVDLPTASRRQAMLNLAPQGRLFAAGRMSPSYPTRSR